MSITTIINQSIFITISAIHLFALGPARFIAGLIGSMLIYTTLFGYASLKPKKETTDFIDKINHFLDTKFTPGGFTLFLSGCTLGLMASMSCI